MDLSFLDSIKMPQALRSLLRKAGILSPPGAGTSYSERLTARAALTKEHAKDFTIGRARLRTGWVVVGILAVVLTGLLLFACVRALRSAVARQGGAVASHSGQVHQVGLHAPRTWPHRAT